MTPRLADTFEIHKYSKKPIFIQLFELNKVNQIKGIKLDFFFSLIPLTRTSVREWQWQNGVGAEEGGSTEALSQTAALNPRHWLLWRLSA